MYCDHMLLAFVYCLFVVPLMLYSVVGIQDSQGDQPMADGTFLFKIKIYLSILCFIGFCYTRLMIYFCMVIASSPHNT